MKNLIRRLGNVFDYIFSRVAKFYFKWDGKTGFTAVLSVTMIQILLIANLTLIPLRLFANRSEIAPYSKLVTNSFFGLILILTTINYFIYRNKYEKLNLKWIYETKKRRVIGGILVIFALILPWVPIILIGIYT